MTANDNGVPWWERNGEPPPDDPEDYWHDGAEPRAVSIIPPELRGEVLDPSVEAPSSARHMDRLRRRAASPVDPSASDIYTDVKAQNDLMRSIAAALKAKDAHRSK